MSHAAALAAVALAVGEALVFSACAGPQPYVPCPTVPAPSEPNPSSPATNAYKLGANPVKKDARRDRQGKVEPLLAGSEGRGCGVLNGVDLRCWDASPQRAEQKTRHAPTIKVEGLPTGQSIVDISVHDGAHCAVVEDGTLWCWGRNYRRIDARAPWILKAPLRRTELPAVDRVMVTEDGTCVRRRADGHVLCWGDIGGDAQSPFGQNQEPNSGATELLALDHVVMCGRFSSGLRCWTQRGSLTLKSEGLREISVSANGITSAWLCSSDGKRSRHCIGLKTGANLRDVQWDGTKICGLTAQRQQLCGSVTSSKATPPTTSVLSEHSPPGQRAAKVTGHDIRRGCQWREDGPSFRLVCGRYNVWLTKAAAVKERRAEDQRRQAIRETVAMSPFDAWEYFFLKEEPATRTTLSTLPADLRLGPNGRFPAYATPWREGLLAGGRYCALTYRALVEAHAAKRVVKATQFLWWCGKGLDKSQLQTVTSWPLSDKEKFALGMQRGKDPTFQSTALEFAGQLGPGGTLQKLWLFEFLSQSGRIATIARDHVKQFLARTKESKGTKGPDDNDWLFDFDRQKAALVACHLGKRDSRLRKRLWRPLRKDFPTLTKVSHHCPSKSRTLTLAAFRAFDARSRKVGGKPKTGALVAQFGPVIDGVISGLVLQGQADKVTKPWSDLVWKNRSQQMLEVLLGQPKYLDRLKLSARERGIAIDHFATHEKCDDAIAFAKQGPWRAVHPRQWRVSCAKRIAPLMNQAVPIGVRIEILTAARDLTGAANLLSQSKNSHTRLEHLEVLALAWADHGSVMSAGLSAALRRIVLAAP